MTTQRGVLHQAQSLISKCKEEMIGFRHTELTVQLLNFEKRYKKIADALTFVGLHLSPAKEVQDELGRVLPELEDFKKKIQEFKQVAQMKNLAKETEEGWVIPLAPLDR